MYTIRYEEFEVKWSSSRDPYSNSSFHGPLDLTYVLNYEIITATLYQRLTTEMQNELLRTFSWHVAKR